MTLVTAVALLKSPSFFKKNQKILRGISYAPTVCRFLLLGKMRTLLRNTSTGLYFKGPDQWTSDPSQAHNFKLIDRALHFVETWHLANMELAFGFDDLDDVTTVPLEKISLKYSES
jgi:hypothetical protein